MINKTKAIIQTLLSLPDFFNALDNNIDEHKVILNFNRQHGGADEEGPVDIILHLLDENAGSNSKLTQDVKELIKMRDGFDLTVFTYRLKKFIKNTVNINQPDDVSRFIGEKLINTGDYSIRTIYTQYKNNPDIVFYDYMVACYIDSLRRSSTDTGKESIIRAFVGIIADKDITPITNTKYSLVRLANDINMKDDILKAMTQSDQQLMNNFINDTSCDTIIDKINEIISQNLVQKDRNNKNFVFLYKLENQIESLFRPPPSNWIEYFDNIFTVMDHAIDNYSCEFIGDLEKSHTIENGVYEIYTTTIKLLQSMAPNYFISDTNINDLIDHFQNKKKQKIVEKYPEIYEKINRLVEYRTNNADSIRDDIKEYLNNLKNDGKAKNTLTNISLAKLMITKVDSTVKIKSVVDEYIKNLWGTYFGIDDNSTLPEIYKKILATLISPTPEDTELHCDDAENTIMDMISARTKPMDWILSLLMISAQETQSKTYMFKFVDSIIEMKNYKFTQVMNLDDGLTDHTTNTHPKLLYKAPILVLQYHDEEKLDALGFDGPENKQTLYYFKKALSVEDDQINIIEYDKFLDSNPNPQDNLIFFCKDN